MRDTVIPRRAWDNWLGAVMTLNRVSLVFFPPFRIPVYPVLVRMRQDLGSPWGSPWGSPSRGVNKLRR